VKRAALKQRRAAELAARRLGQQACAASFLLDGEEGHARVCVHALAGAEACARVYNPTPEPAIKSQAGRVIVTPRQRALPAGEALYAGTGIGALYGLPGTTRFLHQLAGWEVSIPERSTEEPPPQEVLAGLLLDDEEALDAD
jgi:hypothetical protein